MTQPVKGRVTIPSENNFYEETLKIAAQWHADAVRDSDGTHLDPRFKDNHMKIYNAYFPVRGHNDFISQHREEIPEAYLMSARVVATASTVTIAFAEEYFDQQLQPDYRHDPKEYWQVYDRTAGVVIDSTQWTVDQDHNTVTVTDITPWHEFTVSFLAYCIWDPVEMYNHLTNDWGDKPHEMPFDVLQPHSHEFVLAEMKRWLADHPEVDVVRFTTFFYQFTLIFNKHAKEKYVDWFGYGLTVSPRMMGEFEKATGEKLTAEDFVDEGYYNSPFRVPSDHFRQYIDFVSQFVSETAKELVDLVHADGKEAMMFLGDHWIGTEPYGKYFGHIGLDAIVGSVGDGTTTRMIVDIPHVRYREGRFLPYFFPDSFNEHNDPSIEAKQNWIQARRAILRAGMERMGYGGYLSLAAKFPKFVDTVTQITDEFRDIHAHTQDTKPQSNLRVYVLNQWGKLRSWQAFTVAHAIPNKGSYSYYGVMEALSGMNVNVHFLSFQDILKNGIPNDADVLLNMGDEGTAYSGGDVWQNPQLVAAINSFVHQGGGFVGIGDPSAVRYQGQFFQLKQLLGVEREVGYTLSYDKYFTEVTKDHFITQGIDQFNWGESKLGVYSTDEATQILEYSNGEIHLSAHPFGQGQGVYMTGLPFSFLNARLLMRAIYYAAGATDRITQGYADNPACEVSLFPETHQYCVINNSAEAVDTTVYLNATNKHAVHLAGNAIEWGDLE
ncbi:1,3-beta-galactosyl-N-acetylhexosamine phosphorylase [Schleiferilactobacillus perolens]|jgi:1,3-beta-galactosyl-N-acetylhexosamine phosphorylase|uniref:1,3-beta-galactosyl-N-acetylhexosamine phosphorylase n=1 Tax=Schleiferilactobacillus perolens TaxID=100468 RepID=UPI002355C133|nr:1,3-beta-galactosyl-N-acetylhexosamine phosphorylase [Schleiferilactobacillus perolens]MCI2171380.1 1,3-beta-galactosyl-N-acetylhexosamine phosphorylase [Schleiferilactobacillus perolens]